MFKRKKISFRETLLTKKKTDPLHAIYYELTSYSIFYSTKMFLKYASLGIVGTLVDFTIFLGLVYLIGMNYIFAAIIGTIFGIYVNYILNNKYIVKERGYKQIKLNFWYTFLHLFVSFISIVLAIILMIVLVERYNLSYLLGNVISSFVMFLSKYFVHRLLFMKFGH